jgi:transcriptional regulator with XRE-family HTH domain
MDIGYKIKKIREIRNYTQEYMAEQLCISQVSYCRIEKSQTKIDLERFEKIAGILDISPVFLLQFNENDLFKCCDFCDKSQITKNDTKAQDQNIIFEIVKALKMINHTI